MNDLELYVHIPFCARKCSYCDFLSYSADEETKAAYLKALFNEFAFCGDILKNRDTDAASARNADAAKIRTSRRITSVFVGGGTPTVLSALQLSKLFEKLYDCFPIERDAEITAECNPGTLDAGKLSALKQAGVNRLSIGLQSALDSELRLLGRIHTFGEFLTEYKAARHAGFDNINIDIMQALPGQGYEDAMHTVKTVAGLRPEHISAYSLIIEEGTPFHKKYFSHPELLPDEDTDRRIYHGTEEVLGRKGFVHYEISNYSGPGRMCRHNIGYWTGKEYIGMGLGASSLFDGNRSCNTRDPEEYIRIASDGVKMKALEKPGSGNPETGIISTLTDPSSIETLSEKDRMAEFFFLGLRLLGGVERAEFVRRFGVSADEIYGKVLDRFTKEGLLNDDGEWISLSSRGLDICNTVMCEFLQ